MPLSNAVYTSPPGIVTGEAPIPLDISSHAPAVLNFKPLRSAKVLTGFLECRKTSAVLTNKGIDIKPNF